VYAYIGNGPMGAVDPSGHSKIAAAPQKDQHKASDFQKVVAAFILSQPANLIAIVDGSAKKEVEQGVADAWLQLKLYQHTSLAITTSALPEWLGKPVGELSHHQLHKIHQGIEDEVSGRRSERDWITLSDPDAPLGHKFFATVQLGAEYECGMMKTGPRRPPRTLTPFRDPLRPRYNNGATHIDHGVARVFNGSNSPSNLRPLPAETNLRKGGYEGALKRYEDALIRAGMRPEDARKVIQSEIDAMRNSVVPRPMDPENLDKLPAKPSDQARPR
jgi:hypothetical protein